MSFGLTATLLLRLDAHMGQWMSVNTLADYCAVQPEVVIDELEQMVANGLVCVDRDRTTGVIFCAMCGLEGEPA